MTGANVLLDRSRPGIAVLTLSRPQRLNALTFPMFAELRAAAGSVAADPDARVLVVTGAGRGFCSGLDLDEAETLPDLPAARMVAGQEEWSAAVTALARLDIPVVAAVEGAAAGAGFSLALASDIRVAGESARFNAAFVRVGLSGGDCGSSWTLPRVVGLGMAYELLMTGRFVDSAEALRIGLVNRVVPDGQALDAALETAELIAANSPLGVRLTKRLVRANVDAPSLDAAVELENGSQVIASRTADMREALAAFRGRRPARFTGT